VSLWARSGKGIGTSSLAPSSPNCDTFGSTIGFAGSGGGDSIGFTGCFEVVPELGTALQLGLGLAKISAARRRSVRPR